jgi:hypothetical protein
MEVFLAYPNSRDRQPAARRGPRQARLTARAGMVLRRGMEFGPIHDVQSMFMERGVALAPMSCRAADDGMALTDGAVAILPTAGESDLRDGSLSGIVVPGGASGAGEAAGIDVLVKAAHGEGLPIMAFGEGVAQVLAALGLDAPETPPPGVLIDQGMRILEQPTDVADAIRVFHRSPAPALSNA